MQFRPNSLLKGYNPLMAYGLKTESCFDSAHFLTDYEGKCENLHGHRWKVVAYIQVDDVQHDGESRDMVVDFAVFKRALRQISDEFDHMFLVEEGSLAPETIRCLEAEEFKLLMLPFRTTSENLARYFYERLQDAGMPVSQVDVYETPLNCASYFGLAPLLEAGE